MKRATHCGQMYRDESPQKIKLKPLRRSGKNTQVIVKWFIA